MVLRESEILRYMGYAGQEVDQELMGRVRALIAKAEAELNPMYIWATYPVEIVEDGDEKPYAHVIGTTLRMPGYDIVEHLRGAREVGLLAATVGVAYDMLARASAGRPLDSLVFDACGTEAVEVAADMAESEIAEAATLRGMTTTWRYSPGYGDLPLAVQRDFLNTLNAQRRLGVVLTPQLLMVPTKSVTAVVGLFDEPPATADARTKCETCSIRDNCKLRAAGTPCWKR
jgi:hypothetical protein